MDTSLAGTRAPVIPTPRLWTCKFRYHALDMGSRSFWRNDEASSSRLRWEPWDRQERFTIRGGKKGIDMPAIWERHGGFTPCIRTRGREGALAVRRTGAKRSPEALGRLDGGRAQSFIDMEWTLRLKSLKQKPSEIGSGRHFQRDKRLRLVIYLYHW